MATVTKNRAHKNPPFGGVPYGNNSVLKFVLETSSAGVLVDGDKTTALVQTDVARLGLLPAGMRLDDALAIVSDAFTASVTHKIGFAYADGVDDTDVPQDDDYFFAALANTAARTRAANVAVKPVVLPKDAYLIATVAGADHASAGRLDLLVYGELKGAN
jgi:hypothetical protein